MRTNHRWARRCQGSAESERNVLGGIFALVFGQLNHIRIMLSFQRPQHHRGTPGDRHGLRRQQGLQEDEDQVGCSSCPLGCALKTCESRAERPECAQHA